MAKGLEKLLLSTLFVVSLAASPVCPQKNQQETDYIIKVAAGSPIKSRVEEFIKEYKKKGYNMNIEQDCLIDGTTIYIPYFRMSSSMDKHKLYLSLSEKIGWYCDPIKEKVWNDKKEIKKAVIDLTESRIKKDVSAYYSYFNAYIINGEGNKIRITTETIKSMFDGEYFNTVEPESSRIHEKDIGVYDYEETKNMLEENPIFTKLGARDGDYLGKTNSDSVMGTSYYLFRKTEGKWKVRFCR